MGGSTLDDGPLEKATLMLEQDKQVVETYV